MANPNEEREELRRKVELYHALQSLKYNSSFIKLINNGFMKEEVIRLTRLANHEVNDEARAARSRQALAAFVLEDYLSRVNNEGEEARDRIPQLDQIIAQQTLTQEETDQ